MIDVCTESPAPWLKLRLVRKLWSVGFQWAYPRVSFSPTRPSDRSKTAYAAGPLIWSFTAHTHPWIFNIDKIHRDILIELLTGNLIVRTIGRSKNLGFIRWVFYPSSTNQRFLLKQVAPHFSNSGVDGMSVLEKLLNAPTDDLKILDHARNSTRITNEWMCSSILLVPSGSKATGGRRFRLW